MATVYASTQNTGNLIKLLKDIPSVGVPSKINLPYLSSLGYKSKNDRTIVTVFRALNLIDGAGTPNDNYKKLRNKTDFPNALGSLIKKAYQDLFTLYPGANTIDADKLKNFFTSKTDVGEATIRNIVQTFQSLCSIAKFDSIAEDDDDEIPEEERIAKHKPGHNPPIRRGHSGADVHFNIQVHIPGEQKPEVYESIFKNLGKYVLGIKED